MQNTRQGADESLEVCTARIQKIEGGLSMVSHNSDRGRNSVTMKLPTAITGEFKVAAKMVKTVLPLTYL